MDRAVPAAFWRGGTSRGVLFRADDLSAFGPQQVEAVILAALGSPDPHGRQIDGLGGGISSLSKAAIVAPAPAGSDAEVVFRFAQVEVASPKVDFSGNCGNISAAIAPFAVNEGLVAAGGDSVDVVVLNLNSGQRLVAGVPLSEGRYNPTGDFAIDGVPGTGARLRLEYLDPDGSIGRGALPTGEVREQMELPELGPVPVSILDVGNPAVFVPAEALGLPKAAAALPAALDVDEVLQSRLERIRCEAAVRIGVASSLSDAGLNHRTLPKVALVGSPQTYRTTGGAEVPAAEVDLLVRLVSLGKTHRTLAMTAAMACASAAVMDGSVVWEVAAGSLPPEPAWETSRQEGVPRRVRLGHPAGVSELEVTTEHTDSGWRVRRQVIHRTAREIMRGAVQVPQAYLAGEAWFATG